MSGCAAQPASDSAPPAQERVAAATATATKLPRPTRTRSVKPPPTPDVAAQAEAWGQRHAAELRALSNSRELLDMLLDDLAEGNVPEHEIKPSVELVAEDVIAAVNACQEMALIPGNAPTQVLWVSALSELERGMLQLKIASITGEGADIGESFDLMRASLAKFERLASLIGGGSN